MVSLRDTFKKHTGFLRGLKLSYVINNLLNADKLKHNKALYKKYGVKKSIYAPIGSKDFGYSLAGGIPWLDVPGAAGMLPHNEDFKKFSSEEQQQILHFIENGFMILKGFYKNGEIEKLNAEVERLLKEQKTGFNYTGRKIMDAYRFSDIIKNGFFNNKRLLKLLDFIMGKKTIPFQTINFIKGSEQRAHSDSIHMTTQPPGHLIATWTALEQVHQGNGPLFYYPGSHRLPYITTQEYDSGNSYFFIGKNSNKKYEDKIAETIKEFGFQKKYFHADKGDVLIWHANLIHGGEAITQKGATRKSMVAHYFCEGVICYHEISQRPALIG
ncbi:MAG TPA: phytanoyl-CoA dioxygenase [Bacteroidetes bacterium]|nr:phytanoyl-CoA dioxygenase [Bacteroidota bacterium]